MEKSEEERNRWALGLSITLTILIFISFAFYKGYINLRSGSSVYKNQVANVVSAESVPSPIENTKQTFKSAFNEINKQIREFKDSVADVLVPFVTGIEVYKNK